MDLLFTKNLSHMYYRLILKVYLYYFHFEFMCVCVRGVLVHLVFWN